MWGSLTLPISDRAFVYLLHLSSVLTCFESWLYVPWLRRWLAVYLLHGVAFAAYCSWEKEKIVVEKYRFLLVWLNHVVCSFSHHDRSWTRTPFPLGWRLGTWSSSSLGRFAPFHFQTVQTVSMVFWWAKLQNQARHIVKRWYNNVNLVYTMVEEGFGDTDSE